MPPFVYEYHYSLPAIKLDIKTKDYRCDATPNYSLGREYTISLFCMRTGTILEVLGINILLVLLTSEYLVI